MEIFSILGIYLVQSDFPCGKIVARRKWNMISPSIASLPLDQDQRSPATAAHPTGAA
jgi:hypothetical protein